MSDYHFNEAEKVAIWRGDGEKCFYCRTPVPYSELQVDHIVPEKIPSGTFAELRPVLPANFEIDLFKIGQPAIRAATFARTPLCSKRMPSSTTFKWHQNVPTKSGGSWTSLRL